MPNSKAIVPIEQKTVTFYDDQITAVLTEDDTVYIPLRPICDLLGIAWPAQRTRIKRDPILSQELTPCVIVTITQGQAGQRREMSCLPLDFISGFLFGINAQRVKPELQDKIIRYQYECYKTLADAFREGQLTGQQVDIEAYMQEAPDNMAVQAYQMAMAVAKLARQQLAMEIHLQNQAEILEEHEVRLEEIESKLADDAIISEAQASQISQAVKAVAIVLGKQTGRNEFGACYGEIYRKFNITSYRQLPRGKFDEAMTFLTEWHQSLTDDAPF